MKENLKKNKKTFKLGNYKNMKCSPDTTIGSLHFYLVAEIVTTMTASKFFCCHVEASCTYLLVVSASPPLFCLKVFHDSFLQQRISALSKVFNRIYLTCYIEPEVICCSKNEPCSADLDRFHTCLMSKEKQRCKSYNTVNQALVKNEQ